MRVFNDERASWGIPARATESVQPMEPAQAMMSAPVTASELAVGETQAVQWAKAMEPAQGRRNRPGAALGVGAHYDVGARHRIGIFRRTCSTARTCHRSRQRVPVAHRVIGPCSKTSARAPLRWDLRANPCKETPFLDELGRAPSQDLQRGMRASGLTARCFYCRSIGRRGARDFCVRAARKRNIWREEKSICASREEGGNKCRWDVLNQKYVVGASKELGANRAVGTSYDVGATNSAGTWGRHKSWGRPPPAADEPRCRPGRLRARVLHGLLPEGRVRNSRKQSTIAIQRHLEVAGFALGVMSTVSICVPR